MSKIDLFSEANMEEEKKFDWIGFIDPYNIVSAVISVALWIGSQQLKVNPLYVPPNDSLSMFPKVSKNTVENWWMIVFNFGFQFIIVVIFFFLNRKFPSKFRKISPLTTMWCIVVAVCMTGFFTNILKTYVGRPRPDMYAYCGEDATYETCTSIKPSKQKGEFVSFPSGHSSNAMSGCLFICFFLQKAVKIRHLWWTLICSSLFLLAFFVACSRVRDHRHHTDDILAGMFIGFLTTIFVWQRSYKAMFPKNKPFENHTKL